MNSKERTRKAVSHIEDALPIDFGGNPVTGIHCSVVEGLREFYGLERRPVKISCPYQMLGMIDEDLKDAMGIDTEAFWSPYNMFGTSQDNWKQWCTPWDQEVLISGDLIFEERSGGGYLSYAKGNRDYPASGYMPENSYFFDATHRSASLDEGNMNWEDNVEEFTLISDDTLNYYKNAMESQDHSKWQVGSFGGTAIGDISMVPATMLENPRGIRGIEDWYTSTLLYPDYLHKVFDYQTTVALQNLKEIHELLGDNIDSVYICGTDFGTQIGPICSPAAYEELYMPYHKRINKWVHENTGWKTFKHSCGAVEPFISNFIKAGFDILNPVQWTAAGMERSELKSKYGMDLVFWGGGVDTQGTLPFGTEKEVYDEVLQTCRIFGKGGGFVFSSIHNIQAMTPVKNVIAMLNAVKDYNKG